MKSAIAILTLGILASSIGIAQPAREISIVGGGNTLLCGGDGGMMQKDASLPTPVLTFLSFQATKHGAQTSGQFECLALGPTNPKSFEPSSGDFTTNVMYVTGTVNELEIDGSKATLRGKALITGVGAGKDLQFTFRTEEGGPGAHMILTTENPEHGKDPLVFREQMIEGSVRIFR
jgi:hypothetical protein